MARPHAVRDGDDTFLSEKAATPVGWPEIVVGLGIALAVVLRVPPLLAPHEAALGPVLHGLILAGLPAAAALAGFTAASRIRVRPWAAFGLTRPTRHWMLVAAGAGVATVVPTVLAAVALSSVPGSHPLAGAVPVGAPGDGPLAVGVSVLLLAVLVPIGQELLFRGIVTTALLRYGAVVAAAGSAAVFALMQGLTVASAAALFLGLVTAELYRRSGSLWPAVTAHAVHNLVVQGLVLGLAIPS